MKGRGHATSWLRLQGGPSVLSSCFNTVPVALYLLTVIFTGVG